MVWDELVGSLLHIKTSSPKSRQKDCSVMGMSTYSHADWTGSNKTVPNCNNYRTGNTLSPVKLKCLVNSACRNSYQLAIFPRQSFTQLINKRSQQWCCKQPIRGVTDTLTATSRTLRKCPYLGVDVSSIQHR